MSGLLEVTIGASTGFSIFQLTCPSHRFFLDKKFPKLYSKLSQFKTKLKSKGPRIGAKNIEVLPSVKFNFKNRSIWVHHWIWLSFVLGVLTYNAPEQFLFAKSIVAGGALHGFLYKDRFKILTPKATFS